MCRTQQCHQVNECNSGMVGARVQTQGPLRSMRSKKKLRMEIQREMHFLSNKQAEQWIENYVERQTAGARIQVEDAAAEVQQAQEHMNHAQNAGFGTRVPEMHYEGMQFVISDCLSHLACSDNGEDGEDDDEDIEQGKIGEGDKPGCVIGKMSKLDSSTCRGFGRRR
jgi:hypothetical protein